MELNTPIVGAISRAESNKTRKQGQPRTRRLRGIRSLHRTTPAVLLARALEPIPVRCVKRTCLPTWQRVGVLKALYPGACWDRLDARPAEGW